MKYVSIQEAIKKGKGKVSVRGWVHRERGSNKFKFITLRDVTNVIQCIFEKENFGQEWDALDKMQVETSIKLTGDLKEDKRASNGYEINVKEFHIIGESDSYPITKDFSVEHLADNRHLWLRSRKMVAIMKVRSTYIQARDEFFRKEGFHRFDAPIMQPMQCEGGSTLFEVKYYKDKQYLSQSWQLYAEAGVFGLEKIYNMGPTFRAEKSKTSRHLSEFWMAEAEVAWADLHDISELAKRELKYCLKIVAEERAEELKQLGKDAKEILKMVKAEWPTIKYREALKILKTKCKMDVPFGKDLRTIEEEELMKHFDVPIVVTHYPVEVMAFYKPRDPEQIDEALCFDMLAPEGYGEIIGGSQRSLDIKDMEERLKKDGEDVKEYGWYFDLRKYGSIPHSGYGIGVERIVRWVCGLDNIKDAIPFPRTMDRYKP
ncbi:asparagine--tRNA ligase [Candidatus Woesearchaeota archaeon]|jgi:asparaginyl-tRNA synthetase|nr:asparagine--tRNA ligase [Candidatus Woesearchaeota archaeon]MBT4110795.1 asparagine--tRNA ligase [Candidatus Woesearchaeota archaeon]MBT4336693.1 asparagine--tRNA ligase [Candidatus Woesearchaeota archaeon]MBT4469558.1 asparagine--tRNA ligase [Candidatus Woesearchaeota archaeon]MBT6743920.1 asparagine--tRNA ligase [Candidatus Woesearchaeota archaeon]